MSGPYFGSTPRSTYSASGSSSSYTYSASKSSSGHTYPASQQSYSSNFYSGGYTNPPPYSSQSSQYVYVSSDMGSTDCPNCEGCMVIVATIFACIALSFAFGMASLAGRNRKMLVLFGQGVPNFRKHMINFGVCLACFSVLAVSAGISVLKKD